MAKVFTILLVWAVLLTLVLPVAVAGQGEVTPQLVEAGWSASYWDNRFLEGAPEVVRTDVDLSFNWETGSPSPEIEPDTFSARWLTTINVTPGTYRFIVTSDDGIRVWVDDQLILDEWNDHAPTTFYVDYFIPAGDHRIRVDYYEHTGLAVASVSWVRAEEAVGQWEASYWNNLTLQGSPALERRTAEIDFNWSTGSPAPEVINPDTFSARYTRVLNLPEGNYTFMLTTDDGARLWVNDQLLIDAWYVQAANLYTEDIYLSGGQVPVRVEYFENTGFARLQLSWDPERGSIPTDEITVVDNGDTGFIRGGNTGGWQTVNEGYRNDTLWTRSNSRVVPGYNWARWYPTIDPGRYEVFVYIPFRFSTTSQARYWISHAGGLTLRVVDQSNLGEQWVSLGTYNFRGTGAEYVSLADVTFEPETQLVAFDAARWVPR